MAKPAVMELLLDRHDALAVFVGIMRQVTSVELVSAAGFSHRPHGMVLHAMKDLIETAQASGRDLTSQLLDIGFIDVLLDVVRSVPAVGRENCNGVVCAWGFMRTMVILHGEKIDEIEKKFRAERNALRYLIDNNIIFAHSHGLESSTMATQCVANLFGKDEENTFGCACKSKTKHPESSVCDSFLTVAPLGIAGLRKRKSTDLSTSTQS